MSDTRDRADTPPSERDACGHIIVPMVRLPAADTATPPQPDNCENCGEPLPSPAFVTEDDVRLCQRCYEACPRVVECPSVENRATKEQFADVLRRFDAWFAHFHAATETHELLRDVQAVLIGAVKRAADTATPPDQPLNEDELLEAAGAFIRREGCAVGGPVGSHLLVGFKAGAKWAATRPDQPQAEVVEKLARAFAVEYLTGHFRGLRDGEQKRYDALVVVMLAFASQVKQATAATRPDPHPKDSE